MLLTRLELLIQNKNEKENLISIPTTTADQYPLFSICLKGRSTKGT
jgi:hypothetical protein